MAANEEAFPVQINDPKHPLNKWKTVVRNVQNPHGGPPIVQSETVPVCNYCHVNKKKKKKKCLSTKKQARNFDRYMYHQIIYFK